MESNWFTRSIARVVLASYVTQIFAPFIHASEEILTLHPTNPLTKDRLNGRDMPPIQRPITKTQKFVAPPIDEERARSEAETYQYKLRVKTVNSQAGRFQLKLSRKEKGSEGPFDRLHTAMVNKGRVSSTSSTARESEDDTLLNLFKYASFQNFSDHFAWNLSGFKIVVGRDGSVLLDQASTPLLSIYDLVLKTSGELLLQSLGAAELTLQSPRTQIRGAVVTNHLHMDHDVTNEGRLQVRKVSGQGILTNHADFNLDGTTENLAVLGVRQVINKKKGPKEAKIEGSHVHITSDNFSFLNGEGAEFRVTKSLTVDDSPRQKASFTNIGSTYLHGAIFHRSASNSGFWQAHDMTANEKPFINKKLATLKILDRLTALSLSNESEITAKNLIKVTSGNNTGKIHGENLELLVEELMTNTGEVAIKELSGDGTFANQGNIELLGSHGKASQIRIKRFENGTDNPSFKEGTIPVASISGSHIYIDSKNLITHANSLIVAKDRLAFKLYGAIKGNIQANLLEIYGDWIVNFAKAKVSKLCLYGEGFCNRTGASLHVEKSTLAYVKNFDNDGEMVLKGLFDTQTKTQTIINRGRWKQVGTISTPGLFKFQNQGTIICKKGRYLPDSFVVNHGNWILDQMACARPINMSNHGTLELRNSTLNLSGLDNYQNLIFRGGQYTIVGFLHNKRVMSFLEHDWIFTDDANNAAPHRLLIKPSSLPNETGFVTSEGEIESEKNLSYDIPTLPKHIRSEGDIIFSRRHQENRTLADLEKVSANGKVSLYTKDITTTKDYEFGNIGHVDLYVDGVFTTHHSFKAPVITLDVEGPLVGGKDNDVMGTIAATGYDVVFKTELPEDGKPLPRKVYIERQGDRINYTVMALDGRVVEETIDLAVDRILKQDNEMDDLKVFRNAILKKIAKRGHIIPAYGSLTVKAHSVDGRFGKFYGAGPTHIKSTKGDILVGAAVSVEKGSTLIEQWNKGSFWIKFNHNATPQFGIHTWLQQNGAFISSNNALKIESPTKILIDYGQIYSQGSQVFQAGELIRNTAALMASGHQVVINSPEYYHTRANIVSPYPPSHLQYLLIQDSPGSAPALISAMDDIIFNVKKVYNTASDFASGKSIWVNGNKLKKSITKGPSEYIEESQVFCNREWSYKLYSAYGEPAQCTRWITCPIPVAYTQSGNFLSTDNIYMNIGKLVITGTMNSRFFKVTTPGDIDIYGSNPTRRYVDPSRPLLVNQTKAIANQVTPNGFIKRNARNVFETEFPIGAPYKQKGQHMFLVRPDNKHLYKMPMNLGEVIDRLENFSSGLLGLSVQSTLSEWAGRVYIRGSKETPMKALEAHAHEFYEDTGKSHVTPEELLEKASHSMVLWSLEQEENRIYRDMILYIAPKDINPSRGISGEKGIFHAGKNLTLHGAALEFERDVSVTADEKLRLLTLLKRIYTANGHYDTIDGEAKVTSEKGKVTAIGETGFQMKGATLRSFLGLIAGSTHGNSDIEDVLLSHLERHVHQESGGFWGGSKTTHTVTERTSAHASTLQSQSDNVMVVSGEKGKTLITGSHLKAFLALIFKGKELETNASVSKHTSITNTEIEKAFSSSSTTSMQESATINPTTLQGSVIIGDTEKTTYRGTDFLADIFYDNTKDGATLEPTIAMLEYFQQMVSESAFAKSDVGCKGGYEVMHPCRLMVNKVIRTLPEGEMKLNSVLWDKNMTQIIGKFTESTYELKKWHTEWAIHEQMIPNEALVVVALAVGFATQGWGASLISKLSSTMFGTVNVTATATTAATVGPAIKLSALGIAVANAGVSAVCSHIATSTIRTGDIGQVAKGLTSPEFIRSLGISMLSAGLCQQLGAALKIDMNPSLKEVLSEGKIKPVFTDFLQSQALKSGVNMGLNVAVGGQPGSEALVTAARDVALNSVAAWASYKVGDAGFQGKMTPDEQDLAHTGIGALFGVVAHPDKPLEGALTGGLNAFAAARASRIMFGTHEELKTQAEEELRQQGRPVTKETLQIAMNDLLHQKTMITTLLSASATALITRDPSLVSTGIFTATNVVENNCIPSMTKSVLVSEGWVYSERDVKKGFWQDEYTNPDDLYYEMAQERGGESYQNYAVKSHISEGIESIQEALEDKNLSTWQRIALTKELHTMLELQAEMNVTRSAIRYMVAPVKTLVDSKERKLTEINHWVESSHNMLMDTTIPVWQRMGCGLMQESLLNDWEIVRQWPETKLDAGLLMLNASPAVAPVVTATGQAVRMFGRNIGTLAQRVGLRSAQPISIYSGAVRPTQFGILPIHDFSVGHISIPANQNLAMSFSQMERSPAIRKVLADFDQRRGFFTPIERAQLRFVDGKQT